MEIRIASAGHTDGPNAYRGTDENGIVGRSSRHGARTQRAVVDGDNPRAPMGD